MNLDKPATTELPPFWKRLVINFFWLGLAGMIVQVVLIGAASRWWFADLLTHFRVQGFLLGGLLLVVASAFRYRYSAAGLVFLLGVHAWALAPYLPFQTPPALSSDARTLLVWNVYVGNSNHDEIIATIRQLEADVVLLQEVSPELGVKLGGLRDLYPVMEVRPSTDAFGIACLCRDSAAQAEISRLGDELINTAFVNFEDGVTLVGAHTLPPAGSRYSRIRNQQLRELASFVQSQDGPVLVAGDLNVSPWTPHFQRFINETRMADTRRGRGLLNSWPAQRLLTRIPIDHVLVTEQIEVGELKVLSDAHGSDHFPVWCRWEIK